MAAAVRVPYRPLHYGSEKTHSEHKRHRERWHVWRAAQRWVMIGDLTSDNVALREENTHLISLATYWRDRALQRTPLDIPSSDQIVPFRPDNP